MVEPKSLFSNQAEIQFQQNRKSNEVKEYFII